MSTINDTNNPIGNLPDPTEFPQTKIRIGVYSVTPQNQQGYTQDGGDPPDEYPPTLPYMQTENFDTAWFIGQRWETFSGPLQIPIAGPPGTPCSIVQTSAAYSTRVVSWMAARFGLWPFCPHWDQPEYPNQTLRYYSVTPIAPTLAPDGRKYFRVSGIYVYVLKNALDGTETLPAGKLPFDVTYSPGLDQPLFDRSLLGFPV